VYFALVFIRFLLDVCGVVVDVTDGEFPFGAPRKGFFLGVRLDMDGGGVVEFYKVCFHSEAILV